jgi:TolB protein
VSWSPDGSRIAFETYVGDGYAIVIANADGSGARRLTDGSRMQHSPWWSPDGTHLVFVSPVEQRGLPRIQIIDLATGAVKILTSDASTPVLQVSPHWIEWP